MNSKKGYVEFVAGFCALIIVVLVIGQAVFWFQKNCNDNTDCPLNHYCGSDFECHQFPAESTTEKPESHWGPVLVLSLSIIIAAVILRWEQRN